MTSRLRTLRPVTAAVSVFAGFLALTVAAAVALAALAPGLDGQGRAFVVLLALTAGVLWFAPRVFTWSELGVNRPESWQTPRLLVVPALLALSPLAFGLSATGTGLLVLLVVGYLLTGVMEEVLWRGVVQRLLAPLGGRRAVLTTAALFGLAHLANLLFRDNAGLVLAQAWGAFCFGVGYGAVRNRIGTIVPLMVLHFVTDLAAALGAGPTIAVLVAQDVVLLGLGLILLAGPTPTDTPAGLTASTI